MGLHEDFVYLFEVYGFGLVSYGFDEGGDAEVSCSSEQAFCGTYNEGESILGEGVVSEPGQIELAEDELFNSFGG